MRNGPWGSPVDPDLFTTMERAARFQALSLAVELHKGYGVDAASIVRDANRFTEFMINGATSDPSSE